MEPHDPVQAYLASQSLEPRPPGPAAAVRPFITISREAGAGGHALATTLLDKMRDRGPDPLLAGWQVFDQELCVKAVQSPRLRESLQNLLNAETRSPVQDALGPFFGSPPQYSVHHEIFQWIRTVAAAGKAIIVGRGGALVTRGAAPGVHVRLVAGFPARVRRMSGLLGLDEREAADLTREQDAARARLIRMYFGRDIADPLLYDAVWNTEKVPLTAVADSVLDLLQERCAQPAPPAAAMGALR